jgi:hypothetical protein
MNVMGVDEKILARKYFIGIMSTDKKIFLHSCWSCEKLLALNVLSWH